MAASRCSSILAAPPNCGGVSTQALPPALPCTRKRPCGPRPISPVNTQYEQLTVNATPSIRPIFGLNIDWGETFCPDSGCWLNGLETALAYREHSNTRTTVAANTVIPGTIPAPGLSLNVSTLDSYQPTVLEAAIQYSWDGVRIGVAVEQQNWSRLTEDFRGDTIKDQANVQFDDILIPRVGAEVKLGQHFRVTSGVAYEPSPLKSNQSLDVNYLDTDRIVVGLGLTAIYQHVPGLAYPLRMDLGYQHHFLQARDFELTYSNAPTNPYETVTAEGDVDVFAGSVTLKF